MNIEPIKQLKLEIEGILAICERYSSVAFGFAKRIKVSIDNRDADALRYSLDSIIEWYKLNLGEIQSTYSTSYIYKEHVRVSKILHDVRTALEDYTFPESGMISPQNKENQSPIIFISHNRTDSLYADAIRDYLVGLGIKNEQLIYTSHPMHKIPLDANIYAYLRNNITRRVFMIILWSNDYLQSPACLNEMGAAWVVQCDYTNMYVPSFEFGNPKYHECAVDTRKMGAVLKDDQNCKQSMLEFKNKVLELFGLPNSESNTNYLLDQFINAIKAANT